MTEYEKFIAAEELAHWLKSLAVSKTQDEDGEDIYNITDFNGDWVGESFPTPELAFDEIEKMRKEQG
jgi:hypothetical protein